MITKTNQIIDIDRYPRSLKIGKSLIFYRGKSEKA